MAKFLNHVDSCSRKDILVIRNRKISSQLSIKRFVGRLRKVTACRAVSGRTAAGDSSWEHLPLFASPVIAVPSSNSWERVSDWPSLGDIDSSGVRLWAPVLYTWREEINFPKEGRMGREQPQLSASLFSHLAVCTQAHSVILAPERLKVGPVGAMQSTCPSQVS